MSAPTLPAGSLPPPLRLISSMATRQLLADLVARYHASGGCAIEVESVGGVDAAKRVAAGEAFDGVVLALEAIDKLIISGQVVAGSRVDLVRSGVYVAVPTGAAVPDLSDAAAVKNAVLQARTIGLSTGPSGVQLAQLFERWGITDQIKSRLVQALPGVPVARLMAEGQVALGFQQLSELLNMPGIQLLGPLPAEIQITTTFSVGLALTSTRAAEAQAAFAWMASARVADIQRANGMQAAASA
jgi:molybdate transport system substrate-binding protein